MKIDKRNPYHWLLLAQQALYTVIAIGARYLSRRPPKPVVVLYGHQLSGNLKALYDEWQRSYRDKFDCYFLSLDPEYSQQLRETSVCVLQCNKLADMILVGRSDVMITDHGLHALTPFLPLTDIIFVDVWHGIPFKGFTPEDFRIQHRYNEVWVSSPLLNSVYVDKFGFHPSIVKTLGYARVDRLFLRVPNSKSIKGQLSIPLSSRVVLYAPTWQQDDAGRELFPFGENYDSFLKVLSQVCAEQSAYLVVRNHLNTTINHKRFDNVTYCSMSDFPDTENLLQETDILICDWSSISFDYLALNRPALFLDVPPPFKNGFSLGAEYRYGRIIRDMKSLTSELEATLVDSTKYFSEQELEHREVMLNVYGDNTDGQARHRQLEHLVEMFRK